MEMGTGQVADCVGVDNACVDARFGPFHVKTRPITHKS